MTTKPTITTADRIAGALDYARNARTILQIAVDKIQFEERAAAASLELAADAADQLVTQLELTLTIL